jgi:D-xylose transport system permease protein
MSQSTVAAAPEAGARAPRSLRSILLSMEIDTRLLGMIAATAVIWIGFNILSGGSFLTTRNLWNLSVQSASVAVMATGMVLIIVSRNIDLSIGSMLGFTGMLMALLQAEWLTNTLGLGLNHPLTWIIALTAGILCGALIGGLQGFLVAYVGIPSFIVTLGGLLVWRGFAWTLASGRTIAPLDGTFLLLGGGPRGSVGEVLSWLIGGLAVAGLIYALISSRRRRRRYGFPVRPMWADVTIGLFGVIVTFGAVWIANNYFWPEGLARDFAEATGRPWPEGGLQIPTGIANPVLIAIGVTVVMTIVATRRRFGRYVYAIGGNPEAAELGGINTRRTILLTFMLMGILAAVSAAISIARLESAVVGLGVGAELAVIAAAVIGGTSFAGGIGTIPGAVFGAVLMQSLQSGMALLKIDAPIQDIIVGIVLVTAVGLDTVLRRRAGRP